MNGKSCKKIHQNKNRKLIWQVDPTRTGIRVATAAVIGTIKEANKQFSLARQQELNFLYMKNGNLSKQHYRSS